LLIDIVGYSKLVLELFLEFDVPKTSEIVVGAPWIVFGITGESAGRLWRVLTQDVVATDGDRAVV
jgi:hypothetical protein